MLTNRRRGRGFRVGFLLGALLVIVLGAFVVAPLALLHRGAGALEQAYGNNMVDLAARIGAGRSQTATPTTRQPRPGLSLPPGTVENAGRNAYTGSCAQCHGATGDGKGTFGQSTFPPATDLTTAEVKNKSDAELAWIVKNGLGFTAMPAYADVYSDEDIAALVSYIRQLQQGQARVAAVPSPTAGQLAFAAPAGSDAQRGAAVYFAQGCQSCHGGYGDAPDELGIQDVSDLDDAVRHGRPGMPAYSSAKVSDADLKALHAYLESGPPPETA